MTHNFPQKHLSNSKFHSIFALHLVFSLPLHIKRCSGRTKKGMQCKSATIPVAVKSFSQKQPTSATERAANEDHSHDVPHTTGRPSCFRTKSEDLPMPMMLTSAGLRMRRLLNIYDMKKTFAFLVLVLMSLNLFAQKTAILVAQFGSSNEEARTQALDVMFQEVKKAYPSIEVREAYASPTIRRILDRKGVHKDSPTDALLRLHLDGYDKVIVQPTYMLDGIEMNMLREDVGRVSAFFKEVKIGDPLLQKIPDFEEMVEILSEYTVQKDEALLFVGHGNEEASTATYSMLGQMLQHDGQKHAFMGTIEGWPDRDVSISQLDGKKFKKVTLIPFLMVSGVHAHEDIDGEWKPALEEKGYKVDVRFHGLGENAKVRTLILKHLAEAMK